MRRCSASFWRRTILPAVWIADEPTQALRCQVARRAQIVRQRTRLKNQVQSILHRNLVPRPPVADLFGIKGRCWLANRPLPLDEELAVEASPASRARRCDRPRSRDPTQRHHTRQVTFLTAPETRALIDAPDSSRWEGRRDRAILTLAIQAGLRVSELTALNCGDVVLGTAAHVRCEGEFRIRNSPSYSGARVMPSCRCC